MKLCPWNMTLIHSVSPYTAGSETWTTMCVEEMEDTGITDLNGLHIPLIAAVAEVSPNCKVVKIMSCFKLLGRLPQSFYLIGAYPPKSFAPQILLVGRKFLSLCPKGMGLSVNYLKPMLMQGTLQPTSWLRGDQHVCGKEICILATVARPG
jgi:hypothetical protein